MYVVKRNGIYQFRKQIPKDYQAHFGGQADIRTSLHTTQASIARRKALEMLIKVDEIFEVLRSERPVEESRRLVIQMLEQAARLAHGQPWRVEQQIRALNATISEIQSMKLGEDALLRPADFERLDQIVTDRVTHAVQNGHNARYSAAPLSAAIEDYKTKVAPTLNGKHATDVPAKLDFFLAIVGDMPRRDVRPHHLEAFRDFLDTLPQKWQQRFETHNPRLAIERNSQRLRPFDLLTPTTINLKYLGPIRRFFRRIDEGRRY